MSLPTERTLCQIWHEAKLPAELRLTDGSRLHVIYSGVWTHANGPDFASALLDIGGTVVEGSVEIHVRASDWDRHGHSGNKSYNGVALHVVYVDDRTDEVRRPDGSKIPTLEIQRFAHVSDPPATRGGLPFVPEDGNPCLPTLAGGRPDKIREVLIAKGWERLHYKQLSFSQQLEVEPPGQVLYAGIAEALGYSQNRSQMRKITACLPLLTLERIGRDTGVHGVLTALLGVAGFLPISDRLQEIVGISPSRAADVESMYQDLSERWDLLSATDLAWSLNRVRPLNHPARRLASLAELVGECAPDEGLFSRFLAAAPIAGAWDEWLDSIDVSIGSGRRQQIIVNIFAPLYAAFVDRAGDSDGLDQVAEIWERLPGTVRDGVARAGKRQIVGNQRFPIRTALEEQGLHQIQRFGCRQLRCFECPVAELAMQYEN